MYRDTVVSGLFYPSNKEKIISFIESNKSSETAQEAKMIIVPHAGYVFSGATAVKTISRIKLPKNIILLGPNHTGAGGRIAVYPEGKWNCPLGDVPVNEDMVKKLIDKGFESDQLAHVKEHSLEVQLPILKYFRDDLNIVPIAFKGLGFEDCRNAGKVLKDLVSETDSMIVVSSDFNHFEDLETTNEKDFDAINRILDLDSKGLYDTVLSRNISMCGIIPTVVALESLDNIENLKASLVEHTTSAETSGDASQVVGYAGIIIS
ncbi:AmmeMemoRadiSam system protein B [Flexistipes sinusarabici]|uniref:AmmeMemoRadiSam system protein B n=1 Tax=Flexistipes sinusarabici TaxID=2352 RepID=UPI002354D442|nr:AmmeMemoRadiSam system protein B [Flexistipes sinusarabici]